MKESLIAGGIVSIIATWTIVLQVSIDAVNQVGVYAVSTLMFWPVLFIMDAAIAFYDWKTP